MQLTSSTVGVALSERGFRLGPFVGCGAPLSQTLGLPFALALPWGSKALANCLGKLCNRILHCSNGGLYPRVPLAAFALPLNHRPLHPGPNQGCERGVSWRSCPNATSRTRAPWEGASKHLREVELRAGPTSQVGSTYLSERGGVDPPLQGSCTLQGGPFPHTSAPTHPLRLFPGFFVAFSWLFRSALHAQPQRSIL